MEVLENCHCLAHVVLGRCPIEPQPIREVETDVDHVGVIGGEAFRDERKAPADELRRAGEVPAGAERPRVVHGRGSGAFVLAAPARDF